MVGGRSATTARKESYGDFWLENNLIKTICVYILSSARILTCSPTVAGFLPRENRRETQLESWQRRGRYTVTQPGMAALNSILGKAAFVKRQTMASSVEGTQVDFHLLSEDTRYPPSLCVWFGDKLSISRPFWTWAEDEMWHTAGPYLPKYSNPSRISGTILPQVFQKRIRDPKGPCKKSVIWAVYKHAGLSTGCLRCGWDATCWTTREWD